MYLFIVDGRNSADVLTVLFFDHDLYFVVLVVSRIIAAKQSSPKEMFSLEDSSDTAYLFSNVYCVGVHAVLCILGCLMLDKALLRHAGRTILYLPAFHLLFAPALFHFP